MLLRRTGQAGENTFKILRVENILFALVFVGFCTLFIDFEIKTFAKIRLFDFFAGASSLILLTLNATARRFPVRLGLLFVLWYLSDVALMAIPLGKANIIRESLQWLILSVFAITLAQYSSAIRWGKVRIFFGIFAIGAVAYIVIYFLINHIYYGWKEFIATKTLFSFGLPLLYSWLMRNRKKAVWQDYVILLVVALILGASGERKAQLSYMACLGIATLGGFINWMVLPIGGAIIGAALMAMSAGNEQMQRQLMFFAGKQSVHSLSLSELAQAPSWASPSDLQREFMFRITPDIVKAHPIFGIGTNAFTPYMLIKWGPYLPEFMRQGIHNEFQRTVVENGLLGLTLYCAPWVRSAAWVVMKFKALPRRIVMFYAMIMVVTLFECFFEGGGTRAFVAFICIALLPEFFGDWMRNSLRSRSRSSSETTVQVDSRSGHHA